MSILTPPAPPSPPTRMVSTMGQTPEITEENERAIKRWKLRCELYRVVWQDRMERIKGAKT